jgi:Ras-related protein Rab-37
LAAKHGNSTRHRGKSFADPSPAQRTETGRTVPKYHTEYHTQTGTSRGQYDQDKNGKQRFWMANPNNYSDPYAGQGSMANGGYNAQDGRFPEGSLPYDENLLHKTILVGDSGVGKTSLLVQFDQGKFQGGSFAATVGIGFTNKNVNVDGTKVKLQIWDTAGQERFRSITRAYYRDAQALLLLYDVTNKASFDNIRAWLAEINEYAQDDVVIMLLGNKCDMNAERVVSREHGDRLAKEYGTAFMETSAKTGINVDLAFMAIARDLKSKKTQAPHEPKFNVQEYVDREKQTVGCCS